MHEWHWSVYERSSSPFEEVCDPGFGSIVREILEKHLWWRWFGRTMGGEWAVMAMVAVVA
jgi:hypothetical protein